MTTSRLPRLADDLIDASLRCPCDEGDGDLCASCDSLMRLIEAIDIYSFEQLAGVPWHVAASRIRQADQLSRLGALRGLGYTLVGWMVQGGAVMYALIWVLPRAAWITWRAR